MNLVVERSALRHLVSFPTLALFAACSGGASDLPRAGPVPTPEAPRFEHTMAVGPEVPHTADGPTLFAEVCADCHSLRPPAKEAPPMSEVVRRYELKYASRDDAKAAMVFWIRQAAEEWSVMPASEIRERGVMPAQALTVEQAERVADYLFGLRAAW